MVSLADKYAILGQHAQADMMRAQAEQQRAAAGASFDRERAGLLRPQFGEEQKLNQANIGHLGAQTDYIRGPQTAASNAATAGQLIENQYIGPKAQAGINLTNEQTSALGDTRRRASQRTGGGFSNPFSDEFGDNVQSYGNGYKRGMARVPGRGSPKKDTVPAKLAPGEAVLNAPAAEMAGRGNIAALNRRGAGMLGMQPGQGNMPGHFATGTPMVEGPAYSLPIPGHQLPDPNIQSDYQPLPVDFEPAGYTPGSMGPTPHTPHPLFGGFSPAGYTPGSMGPSQRQASPINNGRAGMGYTAGHMAEQRPPMNAAPTPAPRAGFNAGLLGQGGLHQPPSNFAAPQPIGRGMPGVPTPPSRPADLGIERARAGTFGDAFAAARKAAGGAGGMFSYGGKDFQTNIKGEAYRPTGQLRRV
jgi:hypothetical protein